MESDDDYWHSVKSDSHSFGGASHDQIIFRSLAPNKKDRVAMCKGECPRGLVSIDDIDYAHTATIIPYFVWDKEMYFLLGLDYEGILGDFGPTAPTPTRQPLSQAFAQFTKHINNLLPRSSLVGPTRLFIQEGRATVLVHYKDFSGDIVNKFRESNSEYRRIFADLAIVQYSVLVGECDSATPDFSLSPALAALVLLL